MNKRDSLSKKRNASESINNENHYLSDVNNLANNKKYRKDESKYSD